jgi:hypothetical protein
MGGGQLFRGGVETPVGGMIYILIHRLDNLVHCPDNKLLCPA